MEGRVGGFSALIYAISVAVQPLFLGGLQIHSATRPKFRAEVPVVEKHRDPCCSRMQNRSAGVAAANQPDLKSVS